MTKVLFVLLLPALGWGQQLTRTCLVLTGPAKGTVRSFPAAVPIPVGQRCQDGVSSAGVAVPASGSAGSFEVNSDKPVCRDVIGTQVPYRNREGIGKSGLSTIEGNAPIIFLANSIVSSYSRPVRLFLYAHECGHHTLGHVISTLYYQTFIGPPDELAADCFAGNQLRASGDLSSDEWDEVLNFLRTIPGDPTTYPGPQRVKRLKQCVR